LRSSGRFQNEAEHHSEGSGRTPHEEPTHNAVVMGLGNRYFHDDGIGIIVAGELKRQNLGNSVLVRSSQNFDLELLSELRGVSRLVIVDAIRSGTPPGTITKYVVTPRHTPLSAIPGLHSLELHDLIDIGNLTGLLDSPVTVIGVEPKDCRLGEGLSSEVEGALPSVVAYVVEELNPGFVTFGSCGRPERGRQKGGPPGQPLPPV